METVYLSGTMEFELILQGHFVVKISNFAKSIPASSG